MTTSINALPRKATTFFSIICYFLASLISKSRKAKRSRKGTLTCTGSRESVLVLDASPSMLDRDWPPSRLEAARDAAKAYCKRLAAEEPQALIAIVAYGGHAWVICPLTPASQYSRLADHIDGIQVTGATNITDGIRKALSLLTGDTCQVIVLSDGHHNKGPSPRGVAGRLQARAVVETVGIGGRRTDVDEALMMDIASAYPDGTKRYRWIGDKDRLVRHFEELAGGLSRE